MSKSETAELKAREQFSENVHSLRNGRVEELASRTSRLVKSGGARDDSPIWNLGRAKQGDNPSEWHESTGSRARECFRVQQAQGQAAERERGRMHDQR